MSVFSLVVDQSLEGLVIAVVGFGESVVLEFVTSTR